MRTLTFFEKGMVGLGLAWLAAGSMLSSCGRAPSGLLRQGQLPVYDFPLYLTEGVPGNVWKYASDRSRTLLVTGLNDPCGVATDRFNNLYVVEKGANRLLKVNTTTGAYTVVADNLLNPAIVAVSSLGEPFVNQEDANNIIRATDRTVFGTFSSRPTALAFGVGDRMIVGLYDSDRVQWGPDANAEAVTVTDPVQAAVDGTGRVFIAEGSTTGARVLRFHQDSPGTAVPVADQLSGPQGIAVDPVGNIYVVEQGAGRIVLVSHDGTLFQWTSNIVDGQYIAFTQY